MFTGIVKAVGVVSGVKPHRGELKIRVKLPAGGMWALQKGCSVAVDGVCLTVEALTSSTMSFHLGHETLQVTGWTAPRLKRRVVNLEPALKVGDSMGGHFVSGHIDGMAKVIKLTAKGESQLMEVQIPRRFTKYVWAKAFIALNGVSLTVNAVKGARLTVCLVPETLRRANLRMVQSGSLLTFEVDYLICAFLVARLKKT